MVGFRLVKSARGIVWAMARVGGGLRWWSKVRRIGGDLEELVIIWLT